MTRTLLSYLLIFIWLLFFIWHRRPPGRGTSDPGLPRIRSLVDFDASNPTAPPNIRKLFYNAVQAQLEGDFKTARNDYLEVLNHLHNEPNTLNNLSWMEG